MTGSLEITELAAGQGRAVASGDTVTINYVGKRTDGTMFASSTSDGRPSTFEVGMGEVIEGWELGVTGMKVGGKRRLRVPPALGYGARGAPPFVGPNVMLIFEIELVELISEPRKE